MSQVIPISGPDFQAQVLQSDLPVVIDFYADWCPPCRQLGPILDRLAVEFGPLVRQPPLCGSSPPVDRLTFTQRCRVQFTNAHESIDHTRGSSGGA